MDLNLKIRNKILSRIKAPSDQSIGVEIESIIYNNNNERIAVNDSGGLSAINILQNMNEQIKNNGHYSLEPGGQLEWASQPEKNLHDLNHAIKLNNKSISKMLKKNELKIINYGVDPLYRPEEVQLIKQKKYFLMDKLMEKAGSMGKWMMRCTSSVQINFDVSNAQEMEEMVFVADCLHPVGAYLFANSPYLNGELTHEKNMRNIIWKNTDNQRCGNLYDHGIRSPKNLIDNYISYILSVPGIFQLDENGEVETTSQTIGERFVELNKSGHLTSNHVMNGLHQIFTNVRIKDLVEIRGADRTPYGYEIAPAAFWTGLLLDVPTRSKVLDILETWDNRDRDLLNNAAMTLDKTHMGPKGQNYFHWIEYFGDLSLEGLSNRKLLEEKFFESFYETVLNDGPFSLRQQELE